MTRTPTDINEMCLCASNDACVHVSLVSRYLIHQPGVFSIESVVFELSLTPFHSAAKRADYVSSMCSSSILLASILCTV